MSWQHDAAKAARKHGLPVQPFVNQMGQEAHGDDLTSPAGALGPAQLMPATAKAWGVTNPHNRRQSYNAAAQHMAGYVQQFGSLEKALRAYNAGPGAVDKSYKFAETNHYVATILTGYDSKANAPAAGVGAATSVSIPLLGTKTTRTFDQAGFEQAKGTAAVGRLLASRHGTNSVLFKTGVLSTADPQRADFQGTRLGLTSRVTKTGLVQAVSGSKTASPQLGTVLQRANRIDAKHFPYLWGGGHSPDAAHKAVPLDCSGAVSKVLGVNPMVASQFKSFGNAGKGKDVTIYAKDTHVLMSVTIRGVEHFWGTSASNPGGGAGWIPRSAIGADYLRGFVARHPKGM